MRYPHATPSARRAATPRHRRVHRRTHTAAFLIGCIAVWLYVGLVPLHVWHNAIMPPTWFILGAATVPLTLFWVMIHRLRTTDTVSVLQLVVAAVIGGTLAVVLGGSLDSLVALVPQQGRVLSLSVAGFVEEFAKGVLIVAVGRRVAKSTRNGLFVGGAVGLGFAVLETIGYIAQRFGEGDSLIAATGVAVLRGVTAPFGHVLWSSLLGAAIFFAASRTGRFRVSWSVVGAYVGVAVLHGIWDGSATLAAELSGENQVVTYLALAFGVIVPVLVGGLVWRRVARRAAAPAVSGGVAPTAPTDDVPAAPTDAAPAIAAPTDAAPQTGVADDAAPRELVAQP